RKVVRTTTYYIRTTLAILSRRPILSKVVRTTFFILEIWPKDRFRSNDLSSFEGFRPIGVNSFE
ncbi:hypothetical protein GIB67_008881, partial [Kingdonia uniflora]